jgi:enoyl-CoA hydratase
MSGYELIIVDTPAEHVRRITLNRPEKRNAISTPLRVELLDALRARQRSRRPHHHRAAPGRASPG